MQLAAQLAAQLPAQLADDARQAVEVDVAMRAAERLADRLDLLAGLKDPIGERSDKSIFTHQKSFKILPEFEKIC